MAKTQKKTIKKRQAPKKTVQRHHTRKKIKDTMSPDVRRCVVEEINKAKGIGKMSKGEKRRIFDSALRKCLRG